MLVPAKMKLENETVPLLSERSSETNPQTKYRWIIMALFCCLCFLHMAMWSMWAPIVVSATAAIGFTPHDYDLLVNWLPIGVMVTAPLLIWMINKKGARLPVVIVSILMSIGSGLRCIPAAGTRKKYLIHAGQFLNALAGSTVLSAPPLISNTWFPPQERVLATSCMVTLGNLGNAASFIIGPAIVPLPNNCNGSLPNTSVIEPRPCENNIKTVREDINHYLYGVFGITALLSLLVVLLFRNRPDIPPSASAAVERLDITAGLKSLLKQRSWWAACIAFAFVNGAFFGWSGVITMVLAPHGIPEKTADAAGLVMTCAGAAMAVIAGWFSDRIKGRMKWIIVGCYAVMFLTLLYLIIIVMKWINAPPFRYTEGGLWASMVIFGTVEIVSLPLGLELLADIAYPVSEGTSSSVVTWAAMIFMFIFLLVLNSVTNQDVANYLFLAILAVATPVMAFTTTNQNARLNIDKNEEDPTDDQMHENSCPSSSSSRMMEQTLPPQPAI